MNGVISSDIKWLWNVISAPVTRLSVSLLSFICLSAYVCAFDTYNSDWLLITCSCFVVDGEFVTAMTYEQRVLSAAQVEAFGMFATAHCYSGMRFEAQKYFWSFTLKEFLCTLKDIFKALLGI